MTAITQRLAAQNVGRRPVRTLLLASSVALAVAVGFAAYLIGWSVRGALADTDARAGADLVVVPRETLVNLAQSLLTVQPTDATLDARTVARIAAVDGVARASPQRLVRAMIDGRAANVIAFDPATDFTVQPWLRARAGEAVAIDAFLAGARVSASPNDVVLVCGQPLRTHAKLRPTGVGRFDEAHFVSFAGLHRLAALCASASPRAPLHEGACEFDRLDESSAVLVQLAPGARAGNVVFALSQVPGVKVVAGNETARASRDAVGMLFAGVAALALVAGTALVVLVCLVFSATVNERLREIGVLRAVGATPRQVIALVLTEAALVTSAGGACGVVLGAAMLSVFARSLGFHLEAVGIPVAWPPVATVVGAALVAVVVSAALGVAGALVPAWRSQRREPQALLAAIS
jgi:putative ABC transport system permease protein